jgi:hypothetical protein
MARRMTSTTRGSGPWTAAPSTITLTLRTEKACG